MSPRVKQFIDLQNKVNEQIDQHGEADIQLVGELDVLGDSLTGNEINELMMHYENDGDNEPIDEWLDEMAAYTTQMDDCLMGE